MVEASTREGSAADAIDGVVPRQIVEPDTASGLAATLQRASRDRLVTVLRGGGTKLGWGRQPRPIDLLVSTARLNSLLVHRHGDLTATVHAGVTLAQLNRELARHRQWLPVDSAFDEATIGGIVATNDSGPLRHRHGTPRDLLIGVTLALADGRLVKAGGHVVKNVAGYDLGKLVSGSFGSLAAIVDATFKLFPLPQASATLDAGYRDVEAMARDASLIAASQLEPCAFDVSFEGHYRLLVRFASSPAAVKAQVESAQRMLSPVSSLVSGDREAAIWTDHVRSSWVGTGAVVRVGWLPAKLAELTTLVRDVQQITAGGITIAGRVGIGTGLFRLDADLRAQAAALERLRSSVWVGNVAVLRASQELKAGTDVWGPPGSAIAVARALKQTFDPAGILNAERGPV
ncbi:MAG TPA: FAD-binding oxidoreductase [Vicinamibacterales bacterium]|nr:FAD-binding oxidoreductase [Vicinamibacterales bacterium]